MSSYVLTVVDSITMIRVLSVSTQSSAVRSLDWKTNPDNRSDTMAARKVTAKQLREIETAADADAAADAAADFAKYVAVLDAMSDSDRSNPDAIRALGTEAGFIPCGTGSKVIIRFIPGPDANHEKFKQLTVKQLQSAGLAGTPAADHVKYMFKTCTDSSKHWKLHSCDSFGIPHDGFIIPAGSLTHNGSFAEMTEPLKPLNDLANCKTPIPVARCANGKSSSGNNRGPVQSGNVDW